MNELPKDLDPMGLANLMDVAARLTAWKGRDLLMNLNDGEANWHQASFHGRLVDVEFDDGRLKLRFEDEYTGLTLYGDLVEAVDLSEQDGVYIRYRGGDIEILSAPETQR